MKNNKNETKHKLLSTLKDGKERTFEDIVRLLMDDNKEVYEELLCIDGHYLALMRKQKRLLSVDYN
jgi:hypothetical protein